MRNILFFCLFLGLSPLVFGQLGAEFAFDVGSLAVDPITGESINSPYLRCMVDGQEKWIHYDPTVSDGSFNSVSSTYGGVAVCGYINGSFHLQNEVLRTDSDYKTAVAISFGLDGSLKWHYSHNSQVESEFLSSLKMPNGNVIVSGYEGKSSDDNHRKTAILICFNGNGNVAWKISQPQSKGLEIKFDADNNIYWQVKNGSLKSIIYLVDKRNGTFLNVIDQSAIKFSEDPVFEVGADQKLAILGRDENGDVFLKQYSQFGQKQWETHIGNGNVYCKGVIQNPRTGTYIISLQLINNFRIANSDQDLKSGSTESSFLLVYIRDDGGIIFWEQHDSNQLVTNGFFHAGDQVGIVGNHVGSLNIQDNSLVYDINAEGDVSYGYMIYLMEPDASELIENQLTGKGNKVNIQNLDIYPNPVVSKTFNLRISHGVNGVYRVAVYDNTARLQYEYEEVSFDDVNEVSLDTPKLAVGLYHIYLIHIGELENVVAKGRLIIAK